MKNNLENQDIKTDKPLAMSYEALKAERDALADKCDRLEYNLGNAIVGEQEALQRVNALAVEVSNSIDTNLYVALRTKSDIEILNDKHVTICHMRTEPTSKLDVNSIMPEQVSAVIYDVVYWDRANITVAIISSPEVYLAQRLLLESGFIYDLEFIPHITISTGNISRECYGLIGNGLIICDPYIRIKSANNKTPVTDAALAAIQAQGVEKFADMCREKSKLATTADSCAGWKNCSVHASSFAIRLREAK